MTIALIRSQTWVGASVTRKEDDELLRGTRPFVGDLRDGTELHAHVLRSYVSHARLVAIDSSAACDLPGVQLVLTAADLPQPVPRIPLRLWPLEGVERALQPVLAVDRVRYVGEPVALIVADSRYIAEDAAELIEMDYEFLDPVIGLDHAVSASTTRLHEEVDRNIAGTVKVDIGDVEGGVSRSHAVVKGRFSVNRHSGMPLETRGLVAYVEPGSGDLWVLGPTKVAHFNRIVLAELLEMDLERVHFIEPAVGGGFGVRGEFYPEDYLVPYASQLLGARVAWQEDRAEHLLATNHSREQVHDAKLAIDAAGRITGLSVRGRNSMGGYIRSHGATVPTMSAIMFPGPYAIENYSCHIDCVLENKTPTGTYRGPGRYEANFVRERLIDMAARALAIDPADIRRRNFIRADQMPYDFGIDVRMGELHVHQTYDSGDYARQLDEALAASDYEGLRTRRDQLRSEGRCAGLGLATFVEKSGIGAWEYARVEVLPGSGEVVVFTGLASVGQGIETSMAQIAADELGVDMSRVRVVHGDTDVVPRGLGSFASRGTMLGGGAVHLAARRARAAADEIAADALGAGHDAIEFDGDSYRSGPATISLGAVAGLAGETRIEHVGTRRGICCEAVYESEDLGYPYGTHVAFVEIDRETGVIDIVRYVMAYDIGVAVNPLLVHGQLLGGFAQGLGGALLEDFSYDHDGQPRFASFAEYLMPTATDMPDIEIVLTENAPSPVHPLGFKGAGEGGTVAPAAALANAVSDATGVEVFELPLTPVRVLDLLDRSASMTRAETAP